MTASAPAERAGIQRWTAEPGEINATRLIAAKNISVPTDSTSSWRLRISETASTACTSSAAITASRQLATDESGA